MFSFGKDKKPQIGFRKLFGNKNVSVEDQADKLCEVGYFLHAPISGGDCKTAVACLKSTGAWEAVNGNRFYFGK